MPLRRKAPPRSAAREGLKGRDHGGEGGLRHLRVDRRAVRLEGKPRAHAAVAVGLACSGYVFTFRWLDLARPDGISAAGGLTVEALPGADEDLLSGLEERIRGCGEIGRILESGGIDALLDGVLGSLDRESLGRYPVRYACGCDRGSLLSRLRALPQEDLDYLLEQPGGTEAECVYCGTVYLFTPEELAAAQ